jgi:hypothetical protein
MPSFLRPSQGRNRSDNAVTKRAKTLSFACDPVARARIAPRATKAATASIAITMNFWAWRSRRSAAAGSSRSRRNLHMRTTEADESSSALSAKPAVAGLLAITASANPDAPASPFQPIVTYERRTALWMSEFREAGIEASVPTRLPGSPHRNLSARGRGFSPRSHRFDAGHPLVTFPHTGPPRGPRASGTPHYRETDGLPRRVVQASRHSWQRRTCRCDLRWLRNPDVGRLERPSPRARRGFVLRAGMCRPDRPLQLLDLPRAQRHHRAGGVARVHAPLRSWRSPARPDRRCERPNHLGGGSDRSRRFAELVGSPVGFESPPRVPVLDGHRHKRDGDLVDVSAFGPCSANAARTPVRQP